MATAEIRSEPPLVVIVGPTASGKTALAINLAEELGGEIVCADSRTVYRGMDIGTAKPTYAERSRVPHWGLDLVDPDQTFTAADFKRYAEDKITDIRSRGKVPFLVGGSGLYVDAVLFDYQFVEKADHQKRAGLEALSLEELHNLAWEQGVKLPENDKNKRYVIRAIERHGKALGRSQTPLANSIIVGIATYRINLRQRIASRGEQIFHQGIVEEATVLSEKYGWKHESMTGNIYPLIRSYMKGQSSLEEAKSVFATLDWRLAKRQLSWFRRNPYIIWLHLGDAAAYVKASLADT